jgi:retron-type reverse transcriptase
MPATSIADNKSPELLKVVERAKDPKFTFLALAHLIDEAALTRAYHRLRADAAVGIDGITKEQYGQELERNIRSLHERLRTKRWRHQPIRRIHIPKDNGKSRPIGISSTEDKVVQEALRELLEAIYEPIFHDCSYGFRRGRSAHDALRAVNGMLFRGEVSWILEIDVESFFDSINRKMLLEMLQERVVDGSLKRLVGKCLHVGVFDGDEYSESEEGTVQGSVLSPVLGNLYLHHVLDGWFERDVMPRIRGRARLIRYADDGAPRRRGKETARSNGRSFAVREMRAGPSGPGCRTRAQTTGCCSGPMTGVVSETEKAGPTRQVCAVKTNASEPLLTCRKRRDVHRNRAPVVGSGQMRGKPVDCSHGDRHGDGVSTAQALVRNVGTFRLDAKRELQAEDP